MRAKRRRGEERLKEKRGEGDDVTVNVNFLGNQTTVTQPFLFHLELIHFIGMVLGMLVAPGIFISILVPKYHLRIHELQIHGIYRSMSIIRPPRARLDVFLLRGNSSEWTVL